MQTYSETKGKEPFDWNEFLNRENISPNDDVDAYIRAKNWTTCACGNQCSIIPRNSEGKPDDYILQQLGGDNGFYGAVKSKNWDEAKNFLALIEIRSAYLIRKETEKVKENFIKALKQLEGIGVNPSDLINQ